MAFDLQMAFNVLLSLFGTGLGWFGRMFWNKLRDLDASDRETLDRVTKIELLVREDYAKSTRVDEMNRELTRRVEKLTDDTRLQMHEGFNSVFNRLDTIRSEISQKADKR